MKAIDSGGSGPVAVPAATQASGGVHACDLRGAFDRWINDGSPSGGDGQKHASTLELGKPKQGGKCDVLAVQ